MTLAILGEGEKESEMFSDKIEIKGRLKERE